jgi:hypothetical protein
MHDPTAVSSSGIIYSLHSVLTLFTRLLPHEPWSKENINPSKLQLLRVFTLPELEPDAQRAEYGVPWAPELASPVRATTPR